MRYPTTSSCRVGPTSPLDRIAWYGSSFVIDILWNQDNIGVQMMRYHTYISCREEPTTPLDRIGWYHGSSFVIDMFWNEDSVDVQIMRHYTYMYKLQGGGDYSPRIGWYHGSSSVIDMLWNQDYTCMCPYCKTLYHPKVEGGAGVSPAGQNWLISWIIASELGRKMYDFISTTSFQKVISHCCLVQQQQQLKFNSCFSIYLEKQIMTRNKVRTF